MNDTNVITAIGAEDDHPIVPEYSIDLDDMPSVKHNWVKRGIKVSCEGANHPHHSHFLTDRK